MNRIYKVIWSKVKHQYVVVSEFAHSCTKSTGSRVGRSAAAVLAALVLTIGVGSVQANFIEKEDDPTYNPNYDNIIVIDGGTKANSTISVGKGAFTEEGSDGSIAIGVSSRVNGNAGSSIALGYNAHVAEEAKDSIAIGHNSKATEADTVSVGNAETGLKRRVTNAADAIFKEGSSDLVTAGQLDAVGIVPGTVITPGNHNTAIGDAAWIGDGASNNVAIGNGEGGMHGWIGANRHNSVSINGVVHGSQAIAVGENSWIGSDADGSIALGVGARVEGKDSNKGITVAATDSIAIGHNATVVPEANNSIAVGADSKATEANTFSIGSEGNERKLVNVANGTNAHDGVTVGQLQAASDEATKTIHGVTLDHGTISTSVTSFGTDSLTFDDSGLTISNSSFAGVDGTTNIKGNTITTEVVKGLTNMSWDGTTIDRSRAATEGQLADLNKTVSENAKGVVKWDEGTNDTIHGVELAGDGAISAASDRFSVDRYGNIAAQTYGGQGDDTNYYFNMNHADGISMGYSNGTSMNIDPLGVHFKVGEQETLINGNTVVTGRVNADTVQADAMYVGNQEQGNAVVTQNQLTDDISAATKGMVKWDTATDADGNTTYTEGVLHGLKLEGETDGSSTFSTISQVNGNSEITMNKSSVIITADTTDENGNQVYVSTLGTALISGDNAIMVRPNAITIGNAENGGMTVDTDGSVSYTSSNNEGTTVVDGGVITVSNGLDGEEAKDTTISGDSITTGSVTGLTNTTWTGTTNDASRAATEGQLEDLSKTVDENAKGVVKWDDENQNSIHGVGLAEGGHLTATTISANNGHFTVDEDGLTMTRSNGQDVFTVDENGAVTAAGGLFKISDGGAVSGKTMNGTFFNMDDNGIMMGLTADDGQTPGTTVQVTNNGVLFTDGKSEMGTTINGNTIHTGSITATGTSTLGDVKIGEGLVDGVDVSELKTSFGELDKNAVKWDNADQNSIHGVGLEEGGHLTATTISANNGHFTVNEDGLTMTRSNGQDVFTVDENGAVTAAGGLFTINDGGAIYSKTMNGTFFNMDDNGIMMGLTADDGQTPGTKIQVTNNGVLFTDGKSEMGTTINGSTIHTGSITATGTSTLGGVKIGEGLVDGVDVSELATSVGTLDQNAVKYDEDGSLHAGKEGTGQLDLNIDGSASITSSEGNGFTANTDGTNTITGDTNIDGTLAVENGANINGGASISGGASITGGLTVDGVDIGGSVADVSANIEEIKGDVAQNATDISGIKDQIGATGENGALNLSNGATTIESGINTNTSSIKTINDNIGATGENGALKLSNGATTIESGINANTTMIQQNSQAIGQLGHKVGELDSRIDEVGAGAAALAALHPLDFDPDAKWDFAAGYGNYRGENAVAVGTFYRPNEDTMFSVGGTFGNDDNMVNAGVSFKIGAGSSHVTTSRTAMAKEIKSMRDIVAKQDAQIQKLTAMVNALVGVQTETDTTTMFPDVPENHWAYEAVAAKSGLVKGYPDGEFKGDRNMTRYEFAQIVYNAIQAGAEVDARLVEEFKPELEYFHIATVAKDKDGNPTIERVRAN